MSDRVTEAVRRRLLDQQNLKWWKGDKRVLSRENINQLRNEFNIFYNPYYQRFSNLRKSRSMPCTKCNDLGKHCTGVAPAMCPQCAVAGFRKEDCVYLDDPLKLAMPASYGQVAAGGGGSVANAPIQPAVPNRAGAGLAIRLPKGRGSPTGMENENGNENNNGVNTNASHNPNATEEEIAAGRAKRQARRNQAARLEAASALNNLAAGRESAKAVQAMAKAAGGGGGGGGGGKKSRKRKNRKQKLTRKQKL
jgi:hypothetical protein